MWDGDCGTKAGVETVDQLSIREAEIGVRYSS
jgi:hypothetical protein